MKVPWAFPLIILWMITYNMNALMRMEMVDLQCEGALCVGLFWEPTGQEIKEQHSNSTANVVHQCSFHSQRYSLLRIQSFLCKKN